MINTPEQGWKQRKQLNSMLLQFFKVQLFAPNLIHLVNDAKLLISFVAGVDCG